MGVFGDAFFRLILAGPARVDAGGACALTYGGPKPDPDQSGAYPVKTQLSGEG